MASEMGVLDVPEERILRKWRLQPGKMLLIDTEQGRIIEDEEIKRDLAAAKPYSEWLRLHPVQAGGSARSAGLGAGQGRRRRGPARSSAGVWIYPRRPQLLPRTDGQDGRGPDRLHGLRHAPWRCCRTSRSCFTTISSRTSPRSPNPPIDPIREELVMSLVSMIGPRPNLLGRQAGTHKRLEVAQPVLTNADLEKIRAISELLDGAFRTRTLDTTWPAGEGAPGDGAGAGPAVRRGDRRRAGRQQHPDPVRPRCRRGAASPSPPPWPRRRCTTS